MYTKHIRTEKTRIVATTDRFNYKDAMNVSNMATVIQAVMDKEFIEEHLGSCVWVDYKNVVDSDGKPLKIYSWYEVNRRLMVLEKIPESEVKIFREWHKRLYIHHTMSDAIKEGRPLILYIDPLAYGHGISISGGEYKDNVEWVAQIETEQSNNENLLRK